MMRSVCAKAILVCKQKPVLCLPVVRQLCTTLIGPACAQLRWKSSHNIGACKDAIGRISMGANKQDVSSI